LEAGGERRTEAVLEEGRAKEEEGTADPTQPKDEEPKPPTETEQQRGTLDSETEIGETDKEDKDRTDDRLEARGGRTHRGGVGIEDREGATATGTEKARAGDKG